MNFTAILYWIGVVKDFPRAKRSEKIAYSILARLNFKVQGAPQCSPDINNSGHAGGFSDR